MTGATLLVELLTEELPPKALPKLGLAFSNAIVAWDENENTSLFLYTLPVLNNGYPKRGLFFSRMRTSATF